MVWENIIITFGCESSVISLRWSLGHQVWGFYVPSSHCKEMHVSDLKLPKVRQVAVLSSATLVLQFLEGCGHLETAFCSAHLYLKPV